MTGGCVYRAGPGKLVVLSQVTPQSHPPKERHDIPREEGQKCHSQPLPRHQRFCSLPINWAILAQKGKRRITQHHHFSTSLGNPYSTSWVLGTALLQALKLLLGGSLRLVRASLQVQQNLGFDLIFQVLYEALKKALLPPETWGADLIEARPSLPHGCQSQRRALKHHPITGL